MAYKKRVETSNTEGSSTRSLSPEKLEARARNVLLFQLSRSVKTKFQLAQTLQRREIPDEIALPLLDRFEEAGLINDRACAQTIVASRRATKSVSKALLRRELAKKGVAPELIAEVLSELSDESERELAEELAIKRWRSMGELPTETKERRLAGFLMRKGYASSIVFAAIRKAKTQG